MRSTLFSPVRYSANPIHTLINGSFQRFLPTSFNHKETDNRKFHNSVFLAEG